ncbi:MAG: single-stranded DNA-binding protein [Gemmataceae bacterium]
MANLNKVMLIGRLTRDPEPIALGGSTAGAKFGFVVNNRKQNKQTQQWEDVPVWIDCEIWNRGESKQADRVLSSLRKGAQIHIEGHLKLDEWEDKNGGGKRSKLGVVVETFQYLDAKQDGEARPLAARPQQQPAAARNGGGNGGGYSRPAGGGYNGGNGGGGNYDDGAEFDAPSSRGGNKGGSDDDIPF